MCYLNTNACAFALSPDAFEQGLGLLRLYTHLHKFVACMSALHGWVSILTCVSLLYALVLCRASAHQAYLSVSLHWWDCGQQQPSWLEMQLHYSLVHY